MRSRIVRTAGVATALAAAALLAGCSFGGTGTGTAPDPIPSADGPLPSGVEGAAHFDDFALVVGDGDTRVDLYLDPACPHCAHFEETAGGLLAELVDDGEITYSVHPLTFMDRVSTTAYSSRASSAMTCVAVEQPDALLDFIERVFANQPSDEEGLGDDRIAQLAAEAGAAGLDCIDGAPYAAWARAGNDRALEGPIDGAEVERIEGTPTLLVNGVKYEGDVTELPAITDFVESGGR